MAEPTFTDLLAHLVSNFGPIERMIAGAMYLVGFVMIFRGIYALKQYGELRTMMSVNADMKTPIILFVVGSVLIFYPSTINMALTSVFGSNNILAYTPNAKWSSESNETFLYVGIVLRIIGYVGFFRGWLLLTHLGSQGSPPGTLGKALVHIVGGILLVNIFATWHIVETTLGLGGGS